MKPIPCCLPKPNPRSAFTLIEILLVMGIFAIMTNLLYSALFTTMRATASVEQNFRIPRRALMLSSLFEREFSGIYLPEEITPPVLKEGEKPPKTLKERMVFGLIGKEREIHFTTMIPISEKDKRISEITKIAYEFDSADRKLIKKMQEVPDENLEKGGEEVKFDLDLEDVEFAYFDGKWQDKWNSTEAKKLPRAIRATLKLIQADKRGDKSPEELKALAMKHQIIVLLPNAADNRSRM